MSEFGRVRVVVMESVGDELVGDHGAGATSLQLDDAVEFATGGGWLWHPKLGPVQYVGADLETDVVELVDPVPAGVTLEDEDRVLVWDPAKEQVPTVLVAHCQLEGDEMDAGDSVEAEVSHGLRGYFPEGIREDEGEYVQLVLDDDGDWQLVELIGEKALLQPSAINSQELRQFTDDGRWPDRKGWAIDPTTGWRFTLRAGGRNSDGTYALWIERWTQDGELDLDAFVDNMFLSQVYVAKPMKADVAWVNGSLAVIWAEPTGQFQVQLIYPATLERESSRDYPWGGFAKGRKSPAIASDSDPVSTIFVAQARTDSSVVRRARYAFGTLIFTQSLVVNSTLEFRRNLAHFGLRPDIEAGAWQIASTSEGARVYVFDAAGDPMPEHHWRTGTEAGLVGIGVAGDDLYSMDRSGVERLGPAARGSESGSDGDIEDLRRSVTLNFVAGTATLAHDRGAVPTGVLCSSNNNGRRVTWIIPSTTDQELAFYARATSDNSPVDGDVDFSFSAWWD